MINTNYNINALTVLLDINCLSERYNSLIPYKQILIDGFKSLKVQTRNDALDLSDEEYFKIGLNNIDLIKLFRRFLLIYEPNHSKFKEIEKLSLDTKRIQAYNELYFLPGVKQIRAELYFIAGYKKLSDFVSVTSEEIIKKVSETIIKNKMNCIIPLPKEVRTHIAVAKAFLM